METNQEPVIANKIRCICCGQEAVSTYRHDFNRLDSCRNGSFVDGGNDYGRIGGRDLSLIETWNNQEQKWNESNNQVAKDLFREGKYDFPAYSDARDFDFMGYQEKRDAAEKALKEALFAAHGLTGGFAQGDYNNKPDRLWYAVWNMPFRGTRDPDPRDVYFYFLHFVDLVRDTPRRG